MTHREYVENILFALDRAREEKDWRAVAALQGIVGQWTHTNPPRG